MIDSNRTCKFHIGEVSYNKFGTRMSLVNWKSAVSIYVKFLDDHEAIVHTTYSCFKKGQVKNPYDKSVFGVGCVGQGSYKTKVSGRSTPEYLMWMSMLQRCYSYKWRHKFPAYYGKCIVCDEWLNFQKFARWYHENYYPVPKRLHLDKDIIAEGNKIYSPSTCLLVPQRINMLFTSSRKDLEYAEHIERVINEYKDIVSNKVFDEVIKRVKEIKDQFHK